MLAATAMLDEEHPNKLSQPRADNNAYTLDVKELVEMLDGGFVLETLAILAG
jgi:hypothetical protein